MSYSIVNNPGTEFAVDWDVIERLCMSYWRSHYQIIHSEPRDMSERSLNPFSWALPTITTIDVEWDKVREKAGVACIGDMFSYMKLAATDMRAVAMDMKWKVEQTAVNRRRLTNDLKDVQATNIAEMQRAESTYGGLVDACRFVRDTSTDIIAIGATVASGGAAAPLLGASSTLKGVYKYQDTGSAGAAVLYGTGSMLLGVFKLGGAKVTPGQEYALIITQGFLEAGTSLMAGDSFANAVEKGALKIASQGSAQAVFGSSMVKNVFSKMPIPFNIWSTVSRKGSNVMLEDVAPELFKGGAKKLTEKGVKAGLAAGSSALQNSETQRVNSGFADEAPLEDLLLLKLSIVNMKKGIGHGW
jgi:hypothetical protein